MRAELEELRETLRAIRSGEVDAIVVDTELGKQIYTLKSADEPYRVFLEQLTEGAITVSDGGVILYSNVSFANMLSKPLESVIGAKLEDIVLPEDRPMYETLLRKSRSSSSKGNVRLSSGNGAGVPFLLSMSALPQEGPGTTYVVATDITERVRAEEALKRVNEELESKVKERTKRLAALNTELSRSNKELQGFAYAASHDLREPLRTISGFMELLRMEYGDHLDERGKDYIERTVSASSRLHELIDDLLSYSRLETRKKDFAEVDLNQVFTAAMNDLSRVVKERNAMVVSDKLPVVWADDLQMAIVFRNLIDNAIKFNSKSAPEVQVRAKKGDEEWIMSVMDNGIGIDSRSKDKIFAMFSRLHSRTEFPGTGIGLAMCKKIVERHGGRIWFESEKGKGSEFFFTLPLNARNLDLPDDSIKHL